MLLLNSVRSAYLSSTDQKTLVKIYLQIYLYAEISQRFTLTVLSTCMTSSCTTFALLFKKHCAKDNLYQVTFWFCGSHHGVEV